MEEDHLSALPEEIITKIFSYLPINSVVQTSILSKGWLHRWKLAYVLHFSSLPESYTDNPIDYSFVDRCLDLHTAPVISKFIVFARRLDFFPQPNVEHWIDFAIHRHVQFLELYLDVYQTKTRFKIPNSLYVKSSSSASSLEHLALSFVEFNPPLPSLGFTGYPLLKKPFLYRSFISDEGIQSIMETCKALEGLSLILCSGLINLRISSLSLKEFEYLSGHIHSEKLIEIEAPNLETLNTEQSMGIINLSTNCLPVKVNVSMLGWLKDGEWLNARRLVSQLFHVEFLGISTWFPQLKLIAEAIQNDRGPCCNFKNLKTLYVDGVLFHERHLVVLLAILQDCPTLNKLQMESLYLAPSMPKVFPSGPSMNLPQWRKPRFKPLEDGEAMEFRNKIMPIHQLKEIELFFYQGRKDEEGFVKGLLQYAINLEKMVLYFNQSGHQILKHNCPIDFPQDVQEGLLQELPLMLNSTLVDYGYDFLICFNISFSRRN